MKGQDLYEALSHLDPAVVEAAAEPPRQRRVWRRSAMIAACVALLLAGTALAVFCGVEIRILDTGRLEDYQDADPTLKNVKNGSFDQAYQASAQVEITPLSSLSQQIREDAAAGERSRDFDSWEEATAYLGVDLPGPEGPTHLSLRMEEGQISEIRVSVHNQEWHPAINLIAYLYTEYYSGEPGEFVLFSGEFEDIQAEEITLSNGNIAQIVPTFADNGFGIVMGFLGQGQGFYMAAATCAQEDEQQVTEEILGLLNDI